MMIRNILLVGLGGGIGSIARFLCQRALGSFFLNPFPVGTFVVNVSGCFVIGLIHALAVKNNVLSSGMETAPYHRFLWRIYHIFHICR